jgi:hypothetical protein
MHHLFKQKIDAWESLAKKDLSVVILIMIMIMQDHDTFFTIQARQHCERVQWGHSQYFYSCLLQFSFS